MIPWALSHREEEMCVPVMGSTLHAPWALLALLRPDIRDSSNDTSWSVFPIKCTCLREEWEKWCARGWPTAFDCKYVGSLLILLSNLF